MKNYINDDDIILLARPLNDQIGETEIVAYGDNAISPLERIEEHSVAAYLQNFAEPDEFAFA